MVGPYVVQVAQERDDLAGPEVLQLTDLARQVSKARTLRRTVVPVRLPGASGAAMRGGGLLRQHDGPRGRQTLAAWLAT